MATSELSWRTFAINSILNIVDRLEYPTNNSYRRDKDYTFSGSSLGPIYGYFAVDRFSNHPVMCDFHKAKLERSFTIVSKVLNRKELAFYRGFRYNIEELEFEGIYDSTQDHDNVFSGCTDIDSREFGFHDMFFEFSMLYGEYDVKFILTRDILESFGCKAIAMYIIQLYYMEKVGSTLRRT